MNEVVTRNHDEHKRFSPSQSERFFNCPGSTALIERVPARDTSPYAEEGRIAHAVLEAGLRNKDTNVHWAIRHSEYADHELCKGSTNFHYSIQDALDHIWEVVEELDLMYGDVVVGIEEYVAPPSSVVPGEVDGWVDIYIYSAAGRIIHVIDYKHGAGVAKAAEGNTQVTQYAGGLLFGERRVINPANVDAVVLTIIQPRAFHPQGDIRSSTVSPHDVWNYLLSMDAAILKCVQPNAPLNPGVSWCQFCPARSSCPALARSSVAVILNDANADVQDVNKKTLPDVKTLDLGRLSYILAMKPMIMTWLKGVESHADELSRAGIDIPGHKRVMSQSRRQYEGQRDEIAVKLAALIGCHYHELYQEPKLLGIGDMEEKVIQSFKARVGRGKKKQAAEDAAKMFAFFTTKESSGNTVLVPLDDPRPSVSKTQQAFGHIAGLLPTPTEKETT